MSGGCGALAAFVAAGLLVGAGCATEPGAAPDPAIGATASFRTPGAPFDPPPGPEPPAPAGPLGLDRAEPFWPDALACVDGAPVSKRDLAEFLCVSDPRLARLLVEDLAKLRVLRAEVERLGIEVPEDRLAVRMAAIDREVEAAARGAGKSTADFIAERFGISLDVFRAAQRLKLRTLLAQERVVRYARILDDVVEGRILVVETRAAADRIVRQLGQGADFAALARRDSVHASKERGGLLPPVGRWGVHAELEEVLFALSPGGISAPVEIREEGRTLWVVLKSVQRIPARRVPYAAVRDEIERELEERPFEDLEAEGWIQHALRRHEVRILIPAPAPASAAGEEKGWR
ncbi:MAG: peptidylprolyl isomerase [Planctomycetes bacterium]|nr:peptidylprolyl isomerase [Planctomycetota bacterium]